MKAYEIAEIIEKTAPLELAYDWDNSGFQCGSRSREVGRVLLCLDVTPESVRAAIDEGADMIVSHHPLFFKGIKHIDTDTARGAMIADILRHDICVYSSHTCMDTAPEGINTELARLCGIENGRILDPHKGFADAGLGVIGTLNQPMTAGELACMVKARLDSPCIRLIGDKTRKITTAAVGSGSCSELVPIAQSKGAECIITSDIKYHEALTAIEDGMIIIDAGHYPTERFVTGIFARLLTDTGVDTVELVGRDAFCAV